MSLRVTILGCGSSGGVPRLGGLWGDCDPENPKNSRRRCSLLVEREGHDGTTRVLIDTSPDMRSQLLDAGVGALDALVYQRDLLRTLRQLESLRRDMRAARSELAVLMNVHPNSEFELTAASGGFDEPLSVDVSDDQLEIAALENRSELRSEAYQLRIKQREARVALLQMIPGLNLSAGINYTSDSYKVNQRWYDGSLSLTWNIMNLFSGPKNIELAETEQELSEVRRLALSMAVIAQTNIAQLRFSAAKRDFELAQRLADVESRISGQLINQGAAEAGGARQAISGKVEKALADLRRGAAGPCLPRGGVE